MAIPGYYDASGTLADSDAWVAIASSLPDGSTSPIVFTSGTGVENWSQYMDLVIVSYARSNRSAKHDYIKMRPNGVGDAAPTQWYEGNGDVTVDAASDTTTSVLAARVPAATVTDTKVFGTNICTILDINSGKYKSVFRCGALDTDGGSTEAAVDLMSQTIEQQEPITSISLVPYYGSYLVAGSRIDLFGMLPRMVMV